MKKKYKVKGAERLVNNTSSLVFEDPGAAAAYAAQEAFAAGVSPSAVMHSSPDGAGNGDEVAYAPEDEAVADVEGLDELQHSEPPTATEEPVEAPESVEEPDEAYEVADQPDEPLAASEEDEDDTEDDDTEDAELTPEEAMEELAVAEDSDPVTTDDGDDSDAEPEGDDQDD